jgi:predicted SAM-dependent methyltransferase
MRYELRKAALFLFSHRFLALARWELYFLSLRIRNVLAFRRYRIHHFLASRDRPLYLNFGSGPRGLDNTHWVNVDGFPDQNVHFLLDLSRSLPFSDGSFDGVFCEHVLEHFTQEDGENICREIHRILRPGAAFRVVVPDAETIMRWYFEAPHSLPARRGTELAIDSINSYFRQRYEHQFLYDWKCLCAMLERAGFLGSVTRRRFRFGACAELASLDDIKYEPESLYAEAIK